MSNSTAAYQILKLQGVISSRLDVLEDLWSKKKFCDVTLIIEKEKFEVHKIILSWHIPYFSEMFSNDKYKESNAAEIKLSDLDPQIMNLILGYIYGRKLEVTEDNLIKILHHADYLMMKDLKDRCEENLMSATSDETCIEYFLLSRRYKLTALNDKTKLFFNKRSDLLSCHDDFYNLSKEEFSELWLEVQDAETAYVALMEWIKHDLDSRKGLLHELLQNISQDEISIDFFQDNMADEALLKENLQCCLWLLELTTSLLLGV